MYILHSLTKLCGMLGLYATSRNGLIEENSQNVVLMARILDPAICIDEMKENILENVNLR